MIICMISTTLGVLGCEEATITPVMEASNIDQDVKVLDLGVNERLDEGARPDLEEIDEGIIVDMRPEVDPPLIPAEVVVALGLEETPAGIANHISCLVFDQNGAEIAIDPIWGTPRFDLRPLEGWNWEDEETGLAVGQRVGEYEARCHFPSLGLRSEPHTWMVSPGAPKRVITRVDVSEVIAGEVVEAECTVFDEYENMIEGDELTWILDPPLFDLNIDDEDVARFEPTRTGDYTVTCAISEAMGVEATPAPVLVQPGLPAALISTLASGRPIFSVGDVVELSSEVMDQYDNVITGVEVNIETSPPLPRFGERRFYADDAGLYTAITQVEGDTLNDIPLEVRRPFTVEDGAPRITCESPLIGEQTSLASIEVSGRVIDISEISRFTVNGSPVPLDNQGRFSTRVNPTWGLNVVELVAEDLFGAESLERCMFFCLRALSL
jgi:hypothetical protein